MTLTFGSLFAGIGGFDEGLRRAGMIDRFQVEIDPTARQVLARHFPDSRRHDDVTTASAADLGAVDLLCGGFPCQDLSVAGRRAGLAGERSGLFYEFMRLVADLTPRWVLVENVPGLLSSRGGRDMGAVLGKLGQLGYGWAYRSLDAQYFGLAQRRERVFIVGCLGDSAAAAQVLFEPQSGGGDPPPRREAGESVAATLTRGSATGRGINAPGRRREDDVNLVPDVPTYTIKGAAIGREPENGPQYGDYRSDDTSYTLNCTEVHAVAFTQNTRDEVRYINGDGAISGALGAQEGMKQRTYVAQDVPDVYPTLSAYEGGTLTQIPPIRQGMSVRRLTPTECEKLQGFPPGWTAYGADGKAISDSARYRLLGNAVAVPVAAWIARRIVEMDR